jgi:hypothetical protein
MALTYWDESKHLDSQKYDEGDFYYELDKKTVMNQPGAHTGGLINMIFRKKETTVFAAKDKAGNILQKVALPCPPYHHETVREAIPGNFLIDNNDPEDQILA